MLKISLAAMLALSAACGGAPKTATERINLEDSAQLTLRKMESRDPSLRSVLMDADAYAVFPSVGKGGLIVGGAFGRGVLYERGMATGYVELSQASLGAQLGGETFAQLIVLRDYEDVLAIKRGTFDASAGASVTVLTSGAARAASLQPDDNLVIIMPRGGLMVDVSVAGQRFEYRPFNIDAG
jgi:lipid-binding SYLF domain-containing protein